MGLNQIYIRGTGAVSPAGWGKKPLLEALRTRELIAPEELSQPGWRRPILVRTVPRIGQKPAFFGHQRLRRTSPISQYAVAAALEALDTDRAAVAGGQRLGIVFCVLVGCVNYSRRFYDETLRNPATASPLIFPETVFNAPASHLAALLGSSAISYTLVGDSATFLAGLALGVDWILTGEVDGAVIVGAEEMDSLSAQAFHLFDRQVVLAEGAGAIYLKGIPEGAAARIERITSAHSFLKDQNRDAAALAMRRELPRFGANHLLCVSAQGRPRFDAAETVAWRDWPGDRWAPKLILGEGLAASSAWQCVAALDALEQNRYTAASVSVVGSNQQAVGAHFVKSDG